MKKYCLLNRNQMPSVQLSVFIVSTAIIYSLFFAPCSFAISPPESQQFISPYIAQKTPVISSIASSAKPIAVGNAANEGAFMSLQIRTDTFTVPMDAYLVFSIPGISGKSLLFIDEHDNIKFMESGLTPWRTGISVLDEKPFGDISLDLLPGDTYTFYLLLMQPGNTNYYLWNATMSLKPTVVQFAEAIINRFPTEVDGPMAILLSFEMGYSLQQIVDASIKGVINSNGMLADASGNPIIPQNDSLGLIIHYQSERSISVSEDRSFTKEELEESIKKYKSLITQDNNITDKDILTMIISVLCNYITIDRDYNGEDKIIHPADRVYSFFRLYAIPGQFSIPDTIESRTAFLQDSDNFIEIYDGSPDDEDSEPLPANSSIQETFRNRSPVAQDSSVIAIQERTTSVKLYATDPDIEDILTYEAVINPGNGTLSGSGGFINYKSNEGFTGTDYFTFRVSDGKRYSNEATVKIEVKAGVLTLDKVVLSKYNYAIGDKCEESTAESTAICGEYFRLANGTKLYDTYTLNKNRAYYNFQEIYVGLENNESDTRSDYQVTFTFDSPPTNIIPGEKLPILRIEGTARGYTKEWDFNKNFVYYIVNSNDCVSYFEDTAIYLLNKNLSYNEESQIYKGSITEFSDTEITVPLTAGDGFKIGGKFGLDPSYYIEWIYKLNDQ